MDITIILNNPNESLSTKTTIEYSLPEHKKIETMRAIFQDILVKMNFSVDGQERVIHG